MFYWPNALLCRNSVEVCFEHYKNIPSILLKFLILALLSEYDNDRNLILHCKNFINYTSLHASEWQKQ